MAGRSSGSPGLWDTPADRLRRRRQKAADGKKGVSGNVMVYTSMYPDIVNSMCKPKVQKAFPDLKVSWFQGGTEKSRPRSPAK